jgi:hypothetical protein
MEQRLFEIEASDGTRLDFLRKTRAQLERACIEAGPDAQVILFERKAGQAGIPCDALTQSPTTTVGSALVNITGAIFAELGIRPEQLEIEAAELGTPGEKT